LRLASPSAASGGSISRSNGVTLNLVEDIDAKESTGKPKAGREERESLRGLPLMADAAAVDTVPLECRAAVDLVDPVDKGTECSKPSETRDEVNWVVHKT